jgi:hypothetical protein
MKSTCRWQSRITAVPWKRCSLPRLLLQLQQPPPPSSVRSFEFVGVELSSQPSSFYQEFAACTTRNSAAEAPHRDKCETYAHAVYIQLGFVLRSPSDCETNADAKSRATRERFIIRCRAPIVCFSCTCSIVRARARFVRLCVRINRVVRDDAVCVCV